MRTFIAWPSLQRATGGMAVLARMAAHLAEAGHETALVPRERNAATLAVLAELNRDRAPILPWPALPGGAAGPGREDIWLAPEGWPALLLPGLRARARTVVYVQNWAYLLASLPPETDPAQLPFHLLAVSQPVAWHALSCLGKECAILRPGIDVSLFHPARPEAGGAAGLEPGETVRIGWMPRKNKALGGQIQEMFRARQRRAAQDGLGAPPAEWIAIHNRSQGEVAEMLRSCHIFLATGFPEGCPLPPLEAMASGCLVVGFGGFGGWDYMRQAWPQGMRPWWPLRPAGETPWSGNGLYVQDADTIAAALALEYAVALLRRGGAELASVRAAALATAADYSDERHRENLLDLWARASAGVALQPFLG